jgi:hypothetical protein
VKPPKTRTGTHPNTSVLLLPFLAALLVLLVIPRSVEAAASCARAHAAQLVALDQGFSHNHIGASNPSGMIFALRGDMGPGDYLYSDQQSCMFDGGLWGSSV